MAASVDVLFLGFMLETTPNAAVVECRSCCPQCGGAMRLVRVTPRLGALPELKTFRCADCDHVVTVEVEHQPWSW
jgi:hypothetical protein